MAARGREQNAPVSRLVGLHPPVGATAPRRRRRRGQAVRGRRRALAARRTGDERRCRARAEPACSRAGRSAPRGGHPGPGQREAVVDRPAECLVGVAGTMQGGVEEVSGAVPCEHPTGPVPAMGCRCEADKHKPRLGVTESPAAGRSQYLSVACEGGGLDAVSWRQATSLGQSEQLATSWPIRSRLPAVDRTSQRLRCRSCQLTPSLCSTAVCFVRHGTTATTGKVLPGRARGLHLSDQGRERGDEGRCGPCRHVRVGRLCLAARACARRLRPSRRVWESPSSSNADSIECDFGAWTGEPLPQLRKLPEWEIVRHLPSSFRFPGGESFAELQARLADTVGGLCKSHPGEVVVAVSHVGLHQGRARKHGRCAARPLPADRGRTLLDQHGRVRLRGANSACHGRDRRAGCCPAFDS